MKHIGLAAGLFVSLAVAAHGDTREELENGMAEVDVKISSMTCEDLRQEVLRLPEIVENVGAEPENTLEGALGMYFLGLMLRKIAWCIPSGAKRSLGSRKPNRHSPEEAVLLEWHAAVVSGNYEEYKRLLGEIATPFRDEQLASMFREIRRLTPKEISIGEPKVTPRSYEFEAVGCVGIKPMVGKVTVSKKDGIYSVFGVWGPSWNPNIYELHPCF